MVASQARLVASRLVYHCHERSSIPPVYHYHYLHLPFPLLFPFRSPAVGLPDSSPILAHHSLVILSKQWPLSPLAKSRSPPQAASRLIRPSSRTTLSSTKLQTSPPPSTNSVLNYVLVSFEFITFPLSLQSLLLQNLAPPLTQSRKFGTASPWALHFASSTTSSQMSFQSQVSKQIPPP